MFYKVITPPLNLKKNSRSISCTTLGSSPNFNVAPLLPFNFSVTWFTCITYILKKKKPFFCLINHFPANLKNCTVSQRDQTWFDTEKKLSQTAMSKGRPVFLCQNTPWIAHLPPLFTEWDFLHFFYKNKFSANFI